MRPPPPRSTNAPVYPLHLPEYSRGRHRTFQTLSHAGPFVSEEGNLVSHPAILRRSNEAKRTR